MLRISLLLLSATLLTSIPHAKAAAPSPYLTRSDAAMLLLRSAEIPLQERGRWRYPDVLDGQWYTPYMLTAANEGIMDAEPLYGLLHPHVSVGRAEFLKMMSLAFGLTTHIPYQYTDVPRDAWYGPYAGLAYRYGLFRDARNPLLLRPGLRVTHAEAITSVAAVLRHAPHLQPLPEEQLRVFLQRVPVRMSAPILDDASQDQTPSPTVQVPKVYTITTPSMVREAMLRLFQRPVIDSAAETKLDLVHRVNAERRAEGLPVLRHNPQLADAAQQHAKDMFSRGYFSHFTPEGKNYVDRIRAVGYMEGPMAHCPCQPVFDLQHAEVTPTSTLMQSGDLCDCSVRFAVGENIARGQFTTLQVMQDWMQSPNHRRNILESSFDEIGIGIFGDVWVQKFGRAELEKW